MHLDVVQSLSIAGDPTKGNDDRAGAGERHAWVIDGATDLGAPGLLGGRGGAAWIAGEADRAFAASDGQPLKALCRTVFERVADRYERVRTREPEPWERPSAAFLAISITDAILTCAWLGDCTALLIGSDRVTRLGPQPDVRDKEAELAESLAHHRLGRAERAVPVTSALRAARSNSERPVLSIDPRGADRLLIVDHPCRAGDDVLLMTDGFAALVDLYAIATDCELGASLALDGLHGIAARLRAAEAKDADCKRWPRFKQSDDATALWLRIAPGG